MPDTPEPLRIPIAQSVVYAVRGLPEVTDEYNATRTIAPTEISLTYQSTEDSELGRIHAYVKGRWMEGGAEVPMDKPVGRHFWGRNFADWPEWLAAEARLHDPAAVPVPPPAGTEHRAQLLDALDFAYCQGLGYDTPEALLAAYDASRGVSVPPPADQTTAPADWMDGHPHLEAIAAAVWERCEHHDSGLIIDDPRNIAVAGLAAVLAVLPEQTDRAAIARVRALHQQYAFGNDPEDYCAHCNQISSGWIPWPCPTVQALDTELRRVAAEEQPAETGDGRGLMRAHAALAEQAGRDQRALARIRQMADAWEQRLPEVIRTPAVVSAIRSALPDETDRPKLPPMDPVHILGIGAASEQAAETPMFGSEGCTCIPFTRQGGKPRYCGPTDTVDMISGWEIGRDCPHHKPAVGEQPTTCTATIPAVINSAPDRCVAPAGHYDESNEPVFTGDVRSPGGWHTNGQGHVWSDRAAAATPHNAQPEMPEG